MIPSLCSQYGLRLSHTKLLAFKALIIKSDVSSTGVGSSEACFNLLLIINVS